MAREGMAPDDIVAALHDLTDRVEASFILDRLDYMKKGRPVLRRDASGRESVKAPPVHRGQRRQNGRRQKIPRQL